MEWQLPDSFIGRAESNGTPRDTAPANIEAPDPERRLALLRTLGGTARYTAGEWKFTGITDLVAGEKSAGRARRDVKTIRDDLKKAAQAERDARSAGVFANGLGQR